LYYAPSTVTDLCLFVQASGGPSTFRSSTSATAGSWFSHTDTLDNIAPGVTANLFVVVWDSALSPDPLSAAAGGGLWAKSSIFQYTPPTSPAPTPSELLMTGLSSFAIDGFDSPPICPSPEPSPLALIVLIILVLVSS